MYRIASINGWVLPESLRGSFPELDFYESRSAADACAIAERISAEGKTDAILCEAGIADSVRCAAKIPVFPCDPSSFDLLEALHAADRSLSGVQEEIAVVLRNGWEIDLRHYETYLKRRPRLYQYATEEEIPMLVQRLARQGVAAFVGESEVIGAARGLGVPVYCLQAGEAALRSAVRQAVASLDDSRRMRVETRRLEKVLNLSADAVLVADAQGRVVSANESAHTLFGCETGGLIGRSAYELFSELPNGKELLDRRRCKEAPVTLAGKEWLLDIEPIGCGGGEQEMTISLRGAEAVENMERKSRRLRTGGLVAKYDFNDILTRSPQMQAAKELARAYAATGSTILLRGETGSGKELFAHSIHRSSAHCRGPFVAINCAALPENLLESELMGYEEGAFTGARRNGKAGLFELANGGTIFLDEINQVPVHLQGSILRVLQEKQILRIGGSRMVPVDVRVIAASNEDLLALVREGKLRRDLYYRLNTLQIRIPPLRDRQEDVALLFAHYQRLFCRKYGEAPPLSDEALAVLEHYPWPGNVRELMNCAERYVIMRRCTDRSDLDFVKSYFKTEQYEGELLDRLPVQSPPAPEAEALPNRPLDPEPLAASPIGYEAPSVTPRDPASFPPRPLAFDVPASGAFPALPSASEEGEVTVRLGTLREMDRFLAAAAIEHCGGNPRKAVSLLGISRPTLRKLLAEPLPTEQCDVAATKTVKLDTMAAMEAVLIRETLALCHGSRQQAANCLGISRSTLWKHLQEEMIS